MQLTNLYSPVNYLQLEVLLDIFVKNVPSDPKKGHLKCIGNHVKIGKTVCNFVQLILKHSFLFYYVLFGFKKL